MHMVNDKGEAVYYNPVRKHNKDYWVVKGIGSTVVYGRDRRPIIWPAPTHSKDGRNGTEKWLPCGDFIVNCPRKNGQ